MTPEQQALYYRKELLEAEEKIKSLESKLAESEKHTEEIQDILGEKINDYIESRKADDAKIAKLESKLADAEKENKRLIEFIELGSEFHE